MSATLFIGLMSGTSMDGIDGVLVDLTVPRACHVRAHVHHPFDPVLRDRLWQLNRSGDDELHLSALAGNGIARSYADVVLALLAREGLDARQIMAIGAHGQTVRHRPGEFDGWGYTCQLLNGALLAELTQIDVICDFRSRDVAAHGQGAPLVPAFHRALFGQDSQDTAVLNIGGIANLSLLFRDGQTRGHDCGPGNVLLDLWCHRHTGKAYDDQGAWAAGGMVSPMLLDQLLREPYFRRPAPKSTGRDLFNADWLDRQLASLPAEHRPLAPVDVQATLVQFTAQTIVNDLRTAMPEVARVLVCGGGVFNTGLLSALQRELPGNRVHRIQDLSAMAAEHVEAAAFAWLAAQHLAGSAGNCKDVTGADGPRILGARYPA